MFILFATVLLLSIHHGESSMSAMANVLFNGNSTSIGVIYFSQNDANSPVIISGALSLLTPSSNLGFHVHQAPVTETSPNCTAALAHFNPYNTTHGPRTANISSRHVGDLGNITIDTAGSVYINISDYIIQLYNSTQSIVNRAIVIHNMSDDGGMTGMGDSSTTGNAGARVACGLIKLTSNGSSGLNIKPTMSVLFLTIVIAFMMFFY